MLYQNIASDFFIELSHQQQELITGGINFQTSDSNFDRSVLKKTSTNTREGGNDISASTTDFVDYKNTAQSSLSSDTIANSPLAALINVAPNVSSPASSSVILP